MGEANSKKTGKTYRRSGTNVLSEGFREIGARVRTARIKLISSDYRDATGPLGMCNQVLLRIEQGRYPILPDQMAYLKSRLELSGDVLQIYCRECPVGKCGESCGQMNSGMGTRKIEADMKSIETLTVEEFNESHLELIAENLLVLDNLRSQLQYYQLKIRIQLEKKERKIKPRLYLVGGNNAGESAKQKTACQAV